MVLTPESISLFYTAFSPCSILNCSKSCQSQLESPVLSCFVPVSEEEHSLSDSRVPYPARGA